MAIGLAASGIASIAGIIKAGRDKYNESTSVKATVEKLVNGIDKVANTCGKFLSEKGVKLKDLSKKGLKKARGIAKDAKGKSMKELLKSTGDSLAGKYEQAKAKLTGDNVSADEVEDLNSDNTSSIGPPEEGEGSSGFWSSSKDTLRGIFDNIREMNEARKNKDSDGDEDPDGEDSERAILKEIAVALAEGGPGGEGKKEPGFFTRFKERVQGRKDEVEEEKQRVKDRAAKNGKKKGFLEKLLSNPLLWLAGLILSPLRKLASWVVGGITSKFKWLAGSIAKGTGRMLWWVGKKLVKGLWWGLKSVGKGLGKIITRISPKWLKTGLSKLGGFAKSITSGLGKLGGIFKSGLGDLASKMGGWFKNLGSTLASKGGGLLKSAWGGIKSVGKAVFGKGGAVRAIAGTVGRVAVQVGSRVLAGIVAVGPIGWVVGIGLALWGAYTLYKYFKDGKGKFPSTPAGDVSLLRMYSYGLTYNESNNFTKIFELEEVTGRFFRFDKNRSEIVMDTPDEQGNKDIGAILGLSETEYGPFEQEAMKWYGERFLPAYKEFLRCLWLIDDTKKAGELDNLTRNELATLAYNYNVPGGVWEIKNLPFQDTPTSTVTIESYNELLLSVRKELSKEWQDEQARKANSKDNEIKAKNSGGIVQDRNKSKGRTYDPDGNGQGNNGNNIEGDGSDKPLDPRVQSILDGKGLRYGSGSGAGYNPHGYKFKGDPNNGNSGGGGYEAKYKSLPGYEMGDGEGGNVGNSFAVRSLDDAFKEAARMTGVPEQLLWTFAKLESGLNPRAKAKTSSASGLFQFINGTWKSMIGTHGNKYGLNMSNANRFNPLHSALMGAEYMKFNMTYIKGYKELGLDLGTALYLAHFLGGGGVRRLFKAMRANPNAPIQSAIGASQFRANKSLLQGLTIRQFVDKMRDRIGNVMGTPAGKYEGYRNHRAQFAKLYTGKPNDMGDVESFGDAVGGEDGETLPGGSLIAGGGIYSAVMASSEGMGEDGNPVESGGWSSGNSFIDGIVSGRGGSLADLNGGGSGGGYNPHGYSFKDSSGGGNWEERSSGFRDNVTAAEVLGEGYAKGTGGVSKHPIQAGYPFYFTSMYGKRDAKVEGSSKNHGGVDIGVPSKQAGTPIVATGAGKVWRSYNSSSYGQVVYLVHPDGLQTRYAHLVQRAVREGQEVEAGEVIGYMGNTGISGGVHLHFEVRKGHKQESPTIDPLHFPVIFESYKGLRVTTVIEESKGGEEEAVSLDSPEEDKDKNALGYMGAFDLSKIQVDPITGESPVDNQKKHLNGASDEAFGSDSVNKQAEWTSDQNTKTTSHQDNPNTVVNDGALGESKASDIKVDVDTKGMESQQDVTNKLLQEIAGYLKTGAIGVGGAGSTLQNQVLNSNTNSQQGISFSRK